MKQYYFILLALLTLNFGYAQVQLQSPIDIAISSANTAGPSATIARTTPDSNSGAIGLQRGPGVSHSTSGSYTGFMSLGFDQPTLATARTQQDYITWSVNSTNLSYAVEITTLQIAIIKHNNAPTDFRIEYSINDKASWFTAANGTMALSDKLEFIFAPLSIRSTGGGTIHFRLYAFNPKNNQNQPFGIGELSTATSLNNLIQNPGIAMKGNVLWDALVYENGVWSPVPSTGPNSTTGTKNVYIKSGTYTVGEVPGTDKNIQIKSMILADNTKVVVPADASITVAEDLYILGDIFNRATLELNSSSTAYPSLIVNGIVDGKVTYRRHVNSFAKYGDLISAPVTGERFDKFYPNNQNIHKIDANTFLFGPFNKTIGQNMRWDVNQTAILQPATGYSTASTDDQSFTFTGDVNTGSVTQNILFKGPRQQIWNLIGNPFPSYISYYQFLKQNLNALDEDVAAIYGFNATTSAWTILNLADFAGMSDEQAEALKPYLTPGQGFYVASKANGGEVIFNTSIRRVGTSDDFVAGRPSNIKSARAELKMSNGTSVTKTKIYFNDESTMSMDRGYDAAFFGQVAPGYAIYSHILENSKGLDMAIQSLPYDALDNDIIIPIGVNASKGQQLTISLENFTLPEGVEVYLEDNLTNATTLLNKSAYTFTAASSLKGTGRFSLIFKSSTLSTEPTIMDGLHIYTSNKTVYIKGLLDSATTATIYDIQGRAVTTMQLNENSNSNHINLSQVDTGVYIIKLKNNTQEKTQKVILK